MDATTITPALEIRDASPTLTAAVRVWRPMTTLAEAFGELLPRIAGQVAQLGGTIGGAPYARYHAMHEGSVDIEIGAPVIAAVPGLPGIADIERGEVGASELPGGRVAVMVHTGPYATLGASWQRMEGLLAEGGLVESGPGWEDYVDDPEIVPPDRLRTEIVIPVR